jgi:hypothetical protein
LGAWLTLTAAPLKPCLGCIKVELIQSASFQVGGSYVVLQFPISVVVPFGIPHVGSMFSCSGFRFRLPFSGFIKVRHPIKVP